jgi:hypothetical protein
MRQSAQGLPWLAADGLRPDKKHAAVACFLSQLN